jgi:hypothetical protein
VERLKHALYPRLLPIARDWHAKLGRPAPWPDTLDEWLRMCHNAGQNKPTAILLRYRQGDWNALHRGRASGTPSASEWADRLGERRFPVTHGQLAAECAAAGQARPTPLLLHYGPGDHANLHQDLYGDIVFPLQVAIMLSKPDEEFEGGESVFVEQQPRSQSRAIIAHPAQGQGIVFPVRHRPVPGSHGYRRHAMRHGTGDITRGNRTVLGIIFHNAR